MNYSGDIIFCLDQSGNKSEGNKNQQDGDNDLNYMHGNFFQKPAAYKNTGKCRQYGDDQHRLKSFLKSISETGAIDNQTAEIHQTGDHHSCSNKTVSAEAGFQQKHTAQSALMTGQPAEKAA